MVECTRFVTMSMHACWYDFFSSIISATEKSVIITCWGRESPAVWLRAMSRLSATMRSMNLSLRGSRVSAPYRLPSFSWIGSGCLAIISSNTLLSWTAITPRRQPVQPKYLLYE